VCTVSNHLVFEYHSLVSVYREHLIATSSFPHFAHFTSDPSLPKLAVWTWAAVYECGHAGFRSDKLDLVQNMCQIQSAKQGNLLPFVPFLSQDLCLDLHLNLVQHA